MLCSMVPLTLVSQSCQTLPVSGCTPSHVLPSTPLPSLALSPCPQVLPFASPAFCFLYSVPFPVLMAVLCPTSVPTARLVSGLEDVQVYDGEDAVFSLDLSTIIQGTWFLNGEELKVNKPEGQVEPGALRYRMEQKGLQHRLILQAVKHQDSGALVGFSCPGVQDSAALTIQGWCWGAPERADRVKAQKFCWPNTTNTVPLSHKLRSSY